MSMSQFYFPKTHCASVIHFSSFLIFYLLFCFYPYSDLYGQSCNLGCASIDCGEINVGFDPDGGPVFCESEIITLFQNSDAGFDFFIVDWSDGTQDTLYNYLDVTHQYSIPEANLCEGSVQLFKVCFAGVAECGNGTSCQSGSYDFSLKVRPLADFNVDTEICISNLASFTDDSCNATSWSWDFGDGATSTDQNPSHTYANAGDYQVCLTASNDCGDNQECKNVSVVEEPVAAFSYSSNSETICQGSTLDFVNEANLEYSNTEWEILYEGEVDTLAYAFTDTTMTLLSENIEVTFLNVGEYEITLTAENICGVEIETLILTVITTPSITLEPIENQCLESFTYTLVIANMSEGIESMTCNFGNGIPSTYTGINPPPVTFNTFGSDTITVTVNNICGTGIDTETFILVDPNGGATFEPITFCIGNEALDLDEEVSDGDWEGDNVNNSDIFNPNNAGNYTLTYTQNTAGCDIESTLEVSVFNLPSLTLNDQTVCLEDESFTVSASPNGGTWSGDFITANGVFDMTASGLGDFSVTYSYTDNNGCEANETIDITVDNLEVNVDNNDTTFCDNPVTVNFEGVPATANWVWGGNGINPNGVFNPADAGVGTHILTYTATNNNGCTDTGTLEIEVIAPQEVVVDGNITVCETDEDFDLGGEPAGGLWSGSGVNADGQTFSPADANIGQNTLTYTTFEGTSCEETATRTITVIASPALNVPNDFEICLNNGTANLNDAINPSPSGGTWFLDDTELTDVANFNPNDYGIGNYDLAYSYTDENGCENTATVAFEIYEMTFALSSSEASPCNTDVDIDLSADILINNNVDNTNPTAGVWSGNGITDANGIFNPETAGVGTHNLIYEYTDENGCSHTDTLSITVIQIDELIVGSEVESVCQNGEGVVLTSNLAGGTWDNSAVIDAVFYADLLSPFSATQNIELTYSVGGESCNIQESLNITVFPIPNVDAGNNTAICINEGTIILNEQNNVSPNSGGNWYMNDTTNAIIDENVGEFDPTISGTGTFTIFQTYTSDDNCTHIDSMLLTVNGIENAAFGIDSATCIGYTLPLEVEGAGTTCQFLVSTPSSAPDFTNVSNTCDTEYTFNEIGTHDLMLIVTTPQGCKDTMQQEILIVTPPTADYTHPLDTAIYHCEPVVVPLENLGTGYEAVYTWDMGNGDIFTTTNPDTLFNYVYTGDYLISDTIFNITLTVENACGTETYTSYLKVAPLPKVHFAPAVDEICDGTSILFVDGSVGEPETYIIDLGDGSPLITTTQLDTLSHIFNLPIDSIPHIFNVTVVAENYCGNDSLVIPIEVQPNTVIAFFYTDTLSGCPPLAVNVENFATEATYVAYQVTNSLDEIVFVSETPDTTFIFNIPDTYTIAQFANNGCGYDTTYTQINVQDAPIIDSLSVSAPQSCIGESIEFEIFSEYDISEIIYDFGDGDSSSLFNPQHIFTEAGIYDINITVKNLENGCPSTFTFPAAVTIVENPLAPINISPSTGACSPFTVDFSTIETAGNSYFWDWGDGTAVSTEVNPSHTFYAPTNIDTFFNIKLIVTNLATSCKTVTDTIINVYGQADANFSINTPTVCNAPATVSLTVNTQDAILNWDFAGGTNSGTTENPILTFTQTGTYLISLTTTNAANCNYTYTDTLFILPEPTANFNIDGANEGCQAFTVAFDNTSIGGTQWFWDFGNGDTSNVQNPIYTYEEVGTYTVTLIASNNGSCPDTIFFENLVTVHLSPTAAATHDIAEGCEALAVQFTDLSLNADSVVWHFGDNNTSSEFNPIHIYENDGLYTVIQVAYTNSAGFICTDTLVLTDAIEVYPTPSIDPMTNKYVICEGEQIQWFANQFDATDFLWNFGNGDTSTLENPMITYHEAGVYTVQLNVSYNNLCFAEAILTNVIEVIAAPTADFTFESDTIPDFYGIVKFFDNSSSDVVKWYWDFGDGQTDTIPNPEHQYLETEHPDSLYEVRLVVTNIANCPDTVIKKVKVDFFKGLNVPNALQPLSDYEDVRLFKPKGVNLEKYKITIFDKWGGVVWDSEALDKGQPAEGWNGCLFNDENKPLPQGAYYWLITSSIFKDKTEWEGKEYELTIGKSLVFGKSFKQQGTVMLLR